MLRAAADSPDSEIAGLIASVHFIILENPDFLLPLDVIESIEYRLSFTEPMCLLECIRPGSSIDEMRNAVRRMVPTLHHPTLAFLLEMACGSEVSAKNALPEEYDTLNDHKLMIAGRSAAAAGNGATFSWFASMVSDTVLKWFLVGGLSSALKTSRIYFANWIAEKYLLSIERIVEVTMLLTGDEARLLWDLLPAEITRGANSTSLENRDTIMGLLPISVISSYIAPMAQIKVEPIIYEAIKFKRSDLVSVAFEKFPEKTLLYLNVWMPLIDNFDDALLFFISAVRSMRHDLQRKVMSNPESFWFAAIKTANTAIVQQAQQLIEDTGMASPSSLISCPHLHRTWGSKKISKDALRAICRITDIRSIIRRGYDWTTWRTGVWVYLALEGGMGADAVRACHRARRKDAEFVLHRISRKMKQSTIPHF
jgi:hypothetical protein